VSPEDVAALRQPGILDALRAHAGDAPERFALRHGGRADWPVRAMAEQLRARAALRTKLAGWPLERLLATDLEAARSFVDAHTGRTTVDSLEFRFPQHALRDTSTARSIPGRIRNRVDDSGLAPSSVFLELVRGGDFASDVRTYFDALASYGTPRSMTVGGKLRLGGADESAYPAPNEVALFILEALAHAHPFKLTAGLHHPVRHFNETAGCTMHGFLNVFFGAALAAEHDLDHESLARIIADTEPAAFRFTETGIAWRDLRAPTERLTFVRGNLARSIGSCSFDEPREDLHDLGWLAPLSIPS